MFSLKEKKYFGQSTVIYLLVQLNINLSAVQKPHKVIILIDISKKEASFAMNVRCFYAWMMRGE